MTEERRIITKEQFGRIEYSYLTWDDLEPAPKHTDEEYEQVVKHIAELTRCWAIDSTRLAELESDPRVKSILKGKK